MSGITPIGNSLSDKYLNTIANRTIGNRQSLSTKDVDLLLEDCSYLIDPGYKKWFAKHFYRLGTSKVQELARRAKDGNQPQRLFAKLISDS